MGANLQKFLRLSIIIAMGMVAFKVLAASDCEPSLDQVSAGRSESAYPWKFSFKSITEQVANVSAVNERIADLGRRLAVADDGRLSVGDGKGAPYFISLWLIFPPKNGHSLRSHGAPLKLFWRHVFQS